MESRNATKITMFGKKKGDGAAPTLTYSLTSSQPSSYRGGFKKRGEEDRGFGGQSSEKKASTNIFGDTQSYVTTHQQTGVLFGATSSVGGASALSSSPFDASLIRPPKFTPSQTFDSTASSAQNFPSAPSFGSGSGGNGRGGISGVSGQPTTGQNQQTAGGFGGPPKFSGSSAHAFGNLNQLEDFASLSLSQQKQQNFPPAELFSAASSAGGATVSGAKPASWNRATQSVPPPLTVDSTINRANSFSTAPSFGQTSSQHVSGRGRLGGGGGGLVGAGRGRSGVSGQPTTGINQLTAGGFGEAPKFSSPQGMGAESALDDSSAQTTDQPIFGINQQTVQDFGSLIGSTEITKFSI
ncbi:uncharacterized protein LOC126827567 isoform X1 [Patella vulgata]|uniref:uncharacterized protein LOC126827567 isoform X1 n=1 Tax=Patella vulgata TaxID=6465 RepID=UPI0024A7BD73|nr:uncharacterized protein LOC126827567 isoform X1 [Patella vulgata]